MSSSHPPQPPGSLPLSGVRVVDLTSSVAGPFCTQLLGALGADVIKVERPGHGDDTRAWGPPFWDDESAMFLAMNANKRSIGLDLRSERGLGLALQLAERADVVVQSMRPGLVERLGLGYAEIKSRNPEVIYCNIGAYGRLSPLSDQPGYDPLMQAAGGIMSVTGEPDGRPVRVGVSLVDQGTSLWAAIGILAALRTRDQGGGGCEVDASLYETAIGWMGYHLVSHLATGLIPKPVGSRFASIAPYEAFEAADGWMVLAAPNDRLFHVLCGVLDLPELATDPRFATNPDRVANRDQLAAAIGARIATQPVQAWLDRLTEAALPAAPVLNASEVVQSPQTTALGILEAVPGHPIEDLQLVAAPVVFDGHRPGTRRPPPGLGQHTAEICAELGVDGERLAQLRSDGVVA